MFACDKSECDPSAVRHPAGKTNAPDAMDREASLEQQQQDP